MDAKYLVTYGGYYAWLKTEYDVKEFIDDQCIEPDEITLIESCKDITEKFSNK